MCPSELPSANQRIGETPQSTQSARSKFSIALICRRVWVKSSRSSIPHHKRGRSSTSCLFTNLLIQVLHKHKLSCNGSNTGKDVSSLVLFDLLAILPP